MPKQIRDKVLTVKLSRTTSEPSHLIEREIVSLMHLDPCSSVKGEERSRREPLVE